MSSTIQAAIAFPVLFLFMVGLIWAAPAMYGESNDAAILRYEFMYEQSANNKIYSTGSIKVNNVEAYTVYTSPERMQYMIHSIKESIVLLAEGVKSFC
ncbi:MAG: hypothetical protein JW780_02005 [Clostridiales bacterium]|nr:hypothetical protein [Clostridiales bacterium]